MLYFVVWPPSGEKDLLRWYGRVPEGTVAIVHTHPPWLPAASSLDLRTARETQIPVYVLTPFRISKMTGGPSAVTLEGDWIAPPR
jgi:proteasome lid subunit RPN8/RPN11